MKTKTNIGNYYYASSFLNLDNDNLFRAENFRQQLDGPFYQLAATKHHKQLTATK
jgi:hypothetical protein